jgi:hypothetical protein
MKHIILALLFITSFSVFGQSKKVVYFVGRGLYEYERPVPMGNGEYSAYYSNMGETFEKGRIILDSINKSFTVKWLNGDDWIAKYTKTSTKKDVNPTPQSQSEIIYTGKWTDDNSPCALTIKKGPDGCIFQIKSGKVIDEEYKMDAWKKVFTLFTQGECLQTQQ